MAAKKKRTEPKPVKSSDVDPKKRYDIKLDELGLSDDQLKTVRDSIAERLNFST